MHMGRSEEWLATKTDDENLKQELACLHFRNASLTLELSRQLS